MSIIESILPLWFYQAYIVALVVIAVLGFVYDALAKKKLKFFLQERRVRAPKRSAKAAQKLSRVFKTVALNLATSAELSKCGASRRASHLLMLWGFVIAALSILLKYFAFSGLQPLAIQISLNLGGLMILTGALWFLFLRVDYAAEKSFKFTQADIFVLLLLANSALGFVLEAVSYTGVYLLVASILALYLVSLSMLFVTIPWSKFTHVLYKGAYAISRELDELEGVEGLLPTPARTKSYGVPEEVAE